MGYRILVVQKHLNQMNPNLQHTNERLFSPPLAGVGGGISAVESLRNIVINGKTIEIIAIPDHHPLMEKAFRLWYAVYIQELQYPLTDGVDHTNKTLSLPSNGSIVFMAMDGEECVGTIITTCDQVAPPEFEYHKYLGNERNTELTKLIVAKRLRKTSLLLQIFLSAYAFHEKNFSNYPYDNIVFNTNKKMLNYYRVIGHQLVTNEIVIHPKIKNEGYLMYCTRQHFGKVCNELNQIIAGNHLIKAKWAIKYWWYKTLNK